MAVDAVGIGTAGATNRAIGIGATVFRTAVPATPGPKVGAIPTQIGTRNRLGNVSDLTIGACRLDGAGSASLALSHQLIVGN